MARRDGFETRLLSPDPAACRYFYERLGFRRIEGPTDAVRLVRGDCRLAIAPAAHAGAELWLGDDTERPWPNLAKTLGEGDTRRLIDPDGVRLIVGAEGREGGGSAPYDPAFGWYELSLAVANIARTAAFYGQLGFEAADGSLAQRHLTLQRGDARLCLYQGYLDPPETQLIFWQGDVAAVAALAQRAGLGVRSGLASDDEGQVSLMLQDPDGRPLYFIFIPGVVRREPSD